MNVQITPLLVLSLLFPLLGGIIVPFLREQPTSRQAIVPLIASAFSFVSLLFLVSPVLSGTLQSTPSLIFSPQMVFRLRVDALGLFFALVSTFIWMLAAVFSLEYLKNTTHGTRYFSLFSSCLGFTLGIALAGNLFTVFIFYELLTVGSYPLIAHEETPAAKAAAKKYIIYTLLGDALVLFTILLTYYLSGSLELHQHGLIPTTVSVNMLRTLFVCGIFGFGVKSALMPLHGWVADAHPVAPAPASAVLSGVLVNVGVYGILRLVYDIIGVNLMRQYNLTPILATPAMITIVLASVMAFNQDVLKRRLAYSTVAQLSYIILGAAILAPLALQGSIVHLGHHALMKATLFLCAGAIIKYSGKDKVSQLRGVASKLPVIMGLFSVAALSLVGIPPMCGFVSKWLLCTGALEAQNTGSVVVLLVGSLLSALYLLPIIYTAFFQKSDPGTVITVSEKPALSIMIPLVIGAILCIFLGLLVNINGFPLSFAQVISNTFFAP